MESSRRLRHVARLFNWRDELDRTRPERLREMEQSNHRRIAATSLEPADCVKPEISGNRSCVRSFAKAATEQTAAAELPPSDRRRHSNLSMIPDRGAIP